MAFRASSRTTMSAFTDTIISKKDQVILGLAVKRLNVNIEGLNSKRDI
jgi:hypothetical protein